MQDTDSRKNSPLMYAGKAVADAGRHGDSVVVHLSPEEFAALRGQWGEPTINPETGLPEYFKLGNIFKSLLPIAATVAAPFVGPALGEMLGATGSMAPILGTALLGAGTGAITGGGKGALIGGALGGLGGAAMPLLGNSFANAFPETSNSFGISGGANTLFGKGASLFGDAAKAAAASGLGNSIGQNLITENPNFGYFSPDKGMAAVATAPDIKIPTSSSSISDQISGAQSPSWLSRNMNWLPLAAGAGALAMAGGLGGESNNKSRPLSSNAAVPSGNQDLPQYTDNRQAVPVKMSMPEWYSYGMRPEKTFFTNNNGPVKAAHGGLARGSAFVPSMGNGGQDDKIPAQLSDNEYVMDATTVADLGDGNPEAGAKKLDIMRDQIAKQKGRNKRVPPKAHQSALHYLKKVG